MSLLTFVALALQSLGRVEEEIRGLPSMTSTLEGGRGVVEEWTRVLISCVIMYVTRGGGGKKIRNFHEHH